MKKVILRGAKWKYKDINPTKQEVILLVHGHPFNHTMWKYQYDSLNDYRLILPDLKGYGESDFDFEKIFIEEQALDLALLLDELQIERVHLIGLSMGGQITVEFNRLFPQRVNSLIICASTPNPETKESYDNRLKLAELIKQSGMLAYTRKEIHKYINVEEVGKNSEAYQHLFKMMSETKVEGAVASHRGRAERRDNFNFLKNINTPTLIIAGEKDVFFKVDDIEKIATEIPNSQFKIIATSGHLPNLEKSEIFNKLMVEFYEKI